MSGTCASTFIVEHEGVSPPRPTFVDFPMQLEGWLGISHTLEKHFIDTLRFDDHVLADYRFGGGQPVNLYTAYYRSQRKWQSAHSPQSYLPGAGWEVSSFTHMDLPASSWMDRPLHVNRALIQKTTRNKSCCIGLSSMSGFSAMNIWSNYFCSGMPCRGGGPRGRLCELPRLLVQEKPRTSSTSGCSGSSQRLRPN